MKHLRHTRKGSLLGISMVIAVVLAAVGASYISMTTTNIKVAHANFTHHALLNPMESGADLAMLTLAKYLDTSAPGGTWTTTATSVWTDNGWTANGTGYSKLITKEMPLGNGRTATVKVSAQQIPTLANQWKEPYVVVEATANSSATGASTYTRQVAIKLKARTLFDNGMVARKVVDLNGNSYYIDSYKSASGAYNATTNRGDNATVGTLQIDNGVNATGGTIVGNVAAAPGSTVGSVSADIGGAHVYGFDSVSPYDKSGIDPAHISTDFSAEFPIKTYTATSTLPLADPTKDITIGTAGTTTVYKLSQALKLANNKITIAGNVIIIADLDIAISGNGGIDIPSNGSLKIYSSANIDITGNGIMNVTKAGTGVPQNCFIYGTNTTTKYTQIKGVTTETGAQDIKIAGDAAYSGVVYAPNANVTLGGNGTVNGAIIAMNVTCNGGIQFHYDESLSQITEPGFALESWVELTGANKLAMSGFGL